MTDFEYIKMIIFIFYLTILAIFLQKYLSEAQSFFECCFVYKKHCVLNNEDIPITTATKLQLYITPYQATPHNNETYTDNFKSCISVCIHTHTTNKNCKIAVEQNLACRLCNLSVHFQLEGRRSVNEQQLSQRDLEVLHFRNVGDRI